MNKTTLLLFAGLSVSYSLYGIQIQTGMTKAEVRSAIGTEQGSIEMSGKTILMYDNGEVTLEEGVVVRHALKSSEEMEAREARRLRHQAEWQERQAMLREKRIKEGSQILEDRLQSAAFRSLPARDQVRFWRNFQERFPEVDISEHLTLALSLHQSEAAEIERQNELRRLRSRVAAAEASAQRAEESARRAQREAEARESALRYRYTTPFYAVPVPRPITVIHTGRHQVECKATELRKFQNQHRNQVVHRQNNWQRRSDGAHGRTPHVARSRSHD